MSGLASHTVTAPNGGESYARGDAVNVTWSASSAMASGQFGVWLVEPAGHWNIGKVVDAHGSSADYATAVVANVPRDSAYRVVVMYRSPAGGAWSVYDYSDAGFAVN